jgi:hypothetical protein
MKNKIILTILVLSIITLIFSGCDGITTPEIPLLPPSNLRIACINPGCSGVEVLLVWDDNSDNEAGFLVQRMMTVYNPWSEVPDFTPFTKIGEVAPNVNTYKDIAPLATYVLVYRVAAIASDGHQSEWATFDATDAWSGRPTELQAEVSGPPLHVKLNWKDNSRNESGFHIYRWTGIGEEGPWLEAADTEWPLLGTVDADVETFTDTEVKPGYTYRYFLIAFNDDKVSLPSNVETVFIFNQPSLTPEEIELIRKWGYGGDYVVRWPNGYVDVYDATNYSQMQEVLNQWNAVIGGPAILRLSNNPNSQVKIYYKLIFGYCGNRDVKWNEDYTFSTIDIQISDNTASCGYPSTKYALYLFMFKNVAGFKGWTTKGEDVPYEEWTNFTEINDTMKKMVKALYKVPPGYYLGDTKQRKDRSNSVMKNIFTSGGGNCLDAQKK